MPSRVAYLAMALACSLWRFAGVARADEPVVVCSSCHHLRPDAVGPDLRGVIGRRAGAVPGFRYSGPLKRSAIVWTEDVLRRFLRDPQSVVRGNRMVFAGVEDPAQIEAIIAFLRAQ
jgi:cytochrome c